MNTNLNFEDKSTKELLSKLDFEYFLRQNIEIENYNNEDVNKIFSNYKKYKTDLKIKSSQNRKQFYYFTEGQVRKMFTGGLLPAMFELDEGRKHTIFEFEPIGENWAYFDYWKKAYNRKLTREKIWNSVVKTGSILAFILSVLKLYDILSN